MKNKDWHISRKHFVRTLVLSGVALQLPWLNSCDSEHGIPEDVSPLKRNQFRNIQALQITLFPDDGNGPGAMEFNADKYLLWVLNDKRIDPDENQFIIDKLDLFIEQCLQVHGREFYELSDSEQYEFTETISKQTWGNTWISRLLTLIFEALLLDPVYGGNPNRIGWEWLQHDPGFPRPDDRLKYPQILFVSHEV